MTKDKEEAVTIYIMIVSALKMIDNPTGKVSDAYYHLHKMLRKSFLKSQKGTSERVADPEYVRINDKVIQAWDTTRREIIPKDKELMSSMSEILQVLWDRMNRNPLQTMYIGEKRMIGVINALSSARAKKDFSEEEVISNSRKLANRFLELSGIQPRHNLATRKHIIRENLIMEGKEVVL